MDVTGQDLTLAAIAKALGLLSARQEAISANIANVNTPGYRRRDVNFAAQLREAVSAGSVSSKQERIAAVEGVRKNLLVDGSFFSRNDLGSVDIDREMAEEARTQMMYNSFARLASKRFRMYRMAIMDGRA